MIMKIPFNKRLQAAITVTGVTLEETARSVGVSAEELSRWLVGDGTPDVYQFQKITRLFKLPYDWFMEETGSDSDAAEIAPKLGLQKATVEALMELADVADQDVLDAVDASVYAVVVSVETAYDDMIRTVSGILEELGNDEAE